MAAGELSIHNLMYNRYHVVTISTIMFVASLEASLWPDYRGCSLKGYCRHPSLGSVLIEGGDECTCIADVYSSCLVTVLPQEGESNVTSTAGTGKLTPQDSVLLKAGDK